MVDHKIQNRVESTSRRNRKSIRRIYLGLPQSIKEKVFWVGRSFRTNELSHVPGGTDVIVEYKEERIFGYDWIKYPSRYIKTVITRAFSVDREDFWRLEEDQQIELIIGKVTLIYARKYTKKTYETEPFEKVWDPSFKALPWDALEAWEEAREEAENDKLIKQLNAFQ